MERRHLAGNECESVQTKFALQDFECERSLSDR